MAKSKVIGNIGLGSAIEYFTSNQMTVMIPLNDAQCYDLVIDFPEGLKKVEVKTTNYKNSRGKYRLMLNTKLRKFSSKGIDYLFVLTGDGKRYLIPSKEANIQSINFGGKFDSFILR